jgi:hypothetical protein
MASDSLAQRLSGRILLQVESKGQAWYVEPQAKKRVFLGRPADAFLAMRAFGLGVSEADFKTINERLPERLKGRILIRVQSKGEAYYADPQSTKLHFLGRPADAFALMKKLGLGISDANIRSIAVLEGYEEKEYPAQPPQTGDKDPGNEEVAPEPDESGDISDPIEEENGDEDEIVEENLPEPQASEERDLVRTSVSSSFPRLAMSNPEKGLITWWDGYVAYGRIGLEAESGDFSLLDSKRLSGNAEGAVAYNGRSYALAWLKSCRVNLNIIDELGRASEENEIVSLGANACPENVRIAASSANFSLIWTITDSSGQTRLYFRQVSDRGRALGSEQVLAEGLDPTMSPEIIRVGEEFLVFYAQTGERSLSQIRLGMDGAILAIEQLMNEPIKSDLAALALGDETYALAYVEFDGRLVSRIYSIEQEKGLVLEKFYPDYVLGSGPVHLSLAYDGSIIALASLADGKAYFQTFALDFTPVSSLAEVSASSAEVKQLELIAQPSGFGVFWQSDSSEYRGIKYRTYFNE